MVKRAPARRRPRKAKPGTKGLGPAECRLEQPTGEAAEAAEAIEKAGGCVVGSYKEPLAGHPVLLSVLPIDAVQPTPFQRDLSDAHHKRLADVINKTGRFLDPIIAVVAPKEGFWTPNGRHRLEAMRRLGANSITALVVADREVAWQRKMLRVPSRSSPSTSMNRRWSLLVCATNGYRDLVAALTFQSSGDWRPLPMNRSAPPSRITRNGLRWCSTSRRKLRQQ